MPIQLTTPHVDSQDPGTSYQQLRIVRFVLNSVDNIIELWTNYGDTVSGDWASGENGPMYRIRNVPEKSRNEFPALWSPSTAYAVGDRCKNNGQKAYGCVTAGTSDTSDGPKGKGSGLADNDVVWDYLGKPGDFTVLVVDAPASNEFTGLVVGMCPSAATTIYDGVSNELYQWLLDQGHFAGTIV